ncbi:hypothetical protein GJAV_G00103980 [Gymnothorax javanicus]|nr:hypothetical protein GJAV_G00103980 [Gymnothorax javanicus]
MEGFLRSSSAALKSVSEDQSTTFHVVLGNEACDVDSMVSALSFAYFLFKTSGSAGKTPVPILNIRRSDFPLRTDNVGRLSLTLVDHNVLPSTDSDLEEAVVEVIDHHFLERVPSPSCPVTVETVGSCATLVAERIAQKAPEILDRQVAQLLYGSILLDCVNMAPEAGKVTAKDSQYAHLLESRFPDLPPRTPLFQALQSAKFDISGLTTEQMLLKDMKSVAGGDLTVAVSVVYMTLDAFLQRRSLQQELCEFCHKHHFNLLVAMTISFNDNSEPFRQLAVYSSSTLYREEVSRALEHAQNPSLALSPMSSPYTDIRAYLQGNALASRKKLLPIVKDLLQDRERQAARRRRGGDGEDLEGGGGRGGRRPLQLARGRRRRAPAAAALLVVTTAAGCGQSRGGRRGGGVLRLGPAHSHEQLSGRLPIGQRRTAHQPAGPAGEVQQNGRR